MASQVTTPTMRRAATMNLVGDWLLCGTNLFEGKFPVTVSLNEACSTVFLGKNRHSARGFDIHPQEICSSSAGGRFVRASVLEQGGNGCVECLRSADRTRKLKFLAGKYSATVLLGE